MNDKLTGKIKQAVQNYQRFDPYDYVYEVFQETLKYIPFTEREETKTRFKKRLEILNNYFSDHLIELKSQIDTKAALMLAEENNRRAQKELDALPCNCLTFFLLLLLAFYAGYLTKG